MAIVKGYCGLVMVEVDGVYACIDRYEKAIKIHGTLDECEEYFQTYKENIINR